MHFTKLIVLGWVGGAELWEFKIRCSNWGWVCKRQNMFKNWSGGKKFRLIVGSHLHFTKLIVLGWVGGGEMWELGIRCIIGGGCVKDKICLRIGPGGWRGEK